MCYKYWKYSHSQFTESNTYDYCAFVQISYRSAISTMSSEVNVTVASQSGFSFGNVSFYVNANCFFCEITKLRNMPFALINVVSDLFSVLTSIM